MSRFTRSNCKDFEGSDLMPACQTSSSVYKPTCLSSYLSLGVLADLSRHVMSTLDERAGNVVVVNRDDAQRNQEVHQEDHDRVDLRMHLIGQGVGHTVHEGHIVSAVHGDHLEGKDGHGLTLPDTCVCVCVFVCVCVCVCVSVTCEKMASGTASRIDTPQIEPAFRQVQNTALEVWISIGFTMALYL